MSEEAISIKKVILLVVVIWILSLATTLTVIYAVLSISQGGVGEGAITTEKIADSAIVTTKLADGSVTSVKILDGTITGVDIADGSVITVKVADGAVTTDKIADEAVTTDKISDHIVTNLKLAANAIPFKSANGTDSIGKSTATYENITDLSVTITVERNCTLLIMFSAQCQISDPDYSVFWRALVNTDTALPGGVWLQPPLEWGSVSYNFYEPDVSVGEYTVYVQWYVSGGTAWISKNRVLFVIALPT